jgi:hypothetical protein
MLIGLPPLRFMVGYRLPLQTRAKKRNAVHSFLTIALPPEYYSPKPAAGPNRFTVATLFMPQVSLEQAFKVALQYHRAGRLDAAADIYRQILAQRPEDIDAIYFLGVIDHQQGRNELAVTRIRGNPCCYRGKTDFRAGVLRSCRCAAERGGT